MAMVDLQTVGVGAELPMIRSGITGYVDARYTARVVRATAKRLYVDSKRYVERDTGIMKPHYLDYTTRVEVSQ
jgi:hypothetical protein